jgi:hypothetical protein
MSGCLEQDVKQSLDSLIVTNTTKDLQVLNKLSLTDSGQACRYVVWRRGKADTRAVYQEKGTVG